MLQPVAYVPPPRRPRPAASTANNTSQVNRRGDGVAGPATASTATSTAQGTGAGREVREGGLINPNSSNVNVEAGTRIGGPLRMTVQEVQELWRLSQEKKP